MCAPVTNGIALCKTMMVMIFYFVPCIFVVHIPIQQFISLRAKRELFCIHIKLYEKQNNSLICLILISHLAFYIQRFANSNIYIFICYSLYTTYIDDEYVHAYTLDFHLLLCFLLSINILCTLTSFSFALGNSIPPYLHQQQHHHFIHFYMCVMNSELPFHSQQPNHSCLSHQQIVEICNWV